MPRKKQLKVSGSLITSFSVEVKKVKSDHSDSLIDVIHLDIHADGDVYKYDIRKDERAPDINETRDQIEASLEKARNDFLKVEISEYTERFYLFFKVQGVCNAQYTGYRI
ncbi:hypothetical protein LZ24_01392 [Desulfobotulus alkaliphilus]|uniref:Uncharacterized protein n=1 Tax=Desulfobotulus alkaliphilus TaxID=622671 RepID=A0A562RV98_9BACT|nr:hypothetical protein [Desulfobotulus alkaliphilus]TWI72981.1 hypothetical protein LZ24_01392 [Desulfobotulus alkaliphilus]